MRLPMPREPECFNGAARIRARMGRAHESLCLRTFARSYSSGYKTKPVSSMQNRLQCAASARHIRVERMSVGHRSPRRSKSCDDRFIVLSYLLPSKALDWRNPRFAIGYGADINKHDPVQLPIDQCLNALRKARPVSGAQQTREYAVLDRIAVSLGKFVHGAQSSRLRYIIR